MADFCAPLSRWVSASTVWRVYQAEGFSWDTRSINDVLHSKGVDDPRDYLSRFDPQARIDAAPTSLIAQRGSVQMMLKRLISRRDIERRLAKLRFV